MIKCLSLVPGSSLPCIVDLKPFRAVLILEEIVSTRWQSEVSDWLVLSGCLYMMAWGLNCSSWDDSVDYSNLGDWDYGDIPEDRFVFTTRHENETLKNVFWFSKHCARHSVVDLENTLLVHVSLSKNERDLVAEYNEA